jgi:Uncharacterized protein conserved in bacteria C-term(DUF2220)
VTTADRVADVTYERLVQCARRQGWQGTTRTRINADDVRQAFHEAARGRLGDGPPDEALVACVAALHDRGVMTPMSTTNRERIALADGFHLEPIACPVTPVVPPAPIWHRELYDLERHWKDANPLRRARYVAVNRWLKSSADRTPVPVRERCLDVFATFGDPECHPDAEKTLDGRTTAALFGEEERLMSVLRTFRVPPPLLSETVLEETGIGYYAVGSGGDLLLVLENSTTFWSIVECLPRINHHRVGYVAWGLGMSFVRSVRSIAERHGVTEVRYFGDIDVSGIRIPALAASVAREYGLPPVRPAKRLYDALLALGRPAPSRETCSAERARTHLSWLTPQVRPAAEATVVAGNRLAQEWVGLRHLQASNDWHEDLR